MIYDFHNDALTSTLSKRKKIDYITTSLEKGNGIILALWTSKKKLDIDQVWRVLSPFLYLNQSYPNLQFSIEDINLDTNDIEKIVALPFLSYGIVHNKSNSYAGSCLQGGGLTSQGIELEKALLKRNKIVDTAHMSEESFFQTMDVCSGHNVVCSHSCFSCVHENARNLNVEQCALLVQSKGIIGLTLVEDFLGGDSIEDVCRHVDWFVQKFGCDNLAIGTDFFGAPPLKDLSDYGHFDVLSERLTKLGYDKECIDKIFFQNMQSYFAKFV